jgi:hypothetical protein
MVTNIFRVPQARMVRVAMVTRFDINMLQPEYPTSHSPMIGACTTCRLSGKIKERGTLTVIGSTTSTLTHRGIVHLAPQDYSIACCRTACHPRARVHNILACNYGYVKMKLALSTAVDGLVRSTKSWKMRGSSKVTIRKRLGDMSRTIECIPYIRRVSINQCA